MTSPATLPEALRAKRESRLTAEQAAQYLGVKAHSLACWRSSGRHRLPFTKVGNRIFYQVRHLDDFLAANTVGATE